MPALVFMDQHHQLYIAATQAKEGGDYARAIDIYERLAIEGHVYSLVMLGDIHARGLGTEADLAKAEELFDRAAGLGLSEAPFQKANIWLERGDMHRYFLAIEQAARMGLLVAQYYLGLCYEFGRGTEKNATKALQIIREAADRGHLGAKAHLSRRLLMRPYNPVGFTYGLITLLVTIVRSARISLKNSNDERIR